MRLRTLQMAACFAAALLLAGPSRVEGAPKSDKDALRAVARWLDAAPSPLGARLNRPSQTVTTYHDSSGESIYHVVNLDPAGFVVASTDSDVEPVVAFSPEGQFEPDPENPLYAMLQRDLPGRLKQARAAGEPDGHTPAQARAKWNRLENSADPQAEQAGVPSLDDLRVAPLVHSRWNQGSIYDGSAYVACYNFYTPPYQPGSTTNYPCGCVNTAWAQIMRYFRHPTTGLGTNSFRIWVDGVLTSRSLRGGDGAGGPYDWDSMPLAPGVGTTERERQAIGALTAGNAASLSGGGIYAGTVLNSVLSNNVASLGGAAMRSSLVNCLVISNTASAASALYEGSCLNCTVVGNRSSEAGSAVDIGAYEFSPPQTVAAMLRQLVESIQISEPEQQNPRPLLAVVEAAAAAFNRGNWVAAINQLRAFENKVAVQVAPEDPALAEALRLAAQDIIRIIRGTDLVLEMKPAGKGATLKFRGMPTIHYAVEVSADLKNWTAIGRAQEKDGGRFELDDGDASHSRFYRVVVK